VSYQQLMREVRYNDTYANSHKFYRVYVLTDDATNDYRVLFQWGRIGSKGQSKMQICQSAKEAEWAAREKIHSKEAKGYEPHIPSSVSKGYFQTSTVVDPALLLDAGVNTFEAAKSAPKPVTPEDSMETITAALVASLTVDADRAVRLATGTPDDQATAVVIARKLDEKLNALRTAVDEAEARVEVVNILIMEH